MKKEETTYLLLLWSISTFGVIVFIFANSLMPAPVSAGQSQQVYGFLKRLFEFLPFLSHTLVRKMAHALEYALLGAHFAALSRIVLHKPLPLRVGLSLAGVLVAPIDEGIQYFVPGRSASPTDVLIDAGGYLFGLLFLLAFFFVTAKIRQKRGERHANKRAA